MATVTAEIGLLVYNLSPQNQTQQSISVKEVVVVVGGGVGADRSRGHKIKKIDKGELRQGLRQE